MSFLNKLFSVAFGCEKLSRFSKTFKVLIPFKHFKRVLCLVYFLFLVYTLSIGCGQDGENGEKDIHDSMFGELTGEGTEETHRSKDSAVAQHVAALVNGEEISAAELADRLHKMMREGDVPSPLDEYTLNRMRESALTELIERRLIAQQAKEQQITVSETEFRQLVQQVQDEYEGASIQEILAQQGKSYDAWAQAQRETLLLEKLVDINMGAMTTISAEEAQQYYKRNKEKYDYPAQVRASQILAYDEHVAQTAFQELQKDIDFAEIAKKYSESADAVNGGDLGFFGRGVMPPEFDNVIFALNVGDVSSVVKTSYGYQIFKLTGQREAHRISFEEAKEQIHNLLQKKKRMLVVDLWLSELYANAKIVLNHDAIKQVN